MTNQPEFYEDDEPPKPAWRRGQEVMSAARKEWGVGRVAAVQETHVNGQPILRVTVDFPVVGRKTLVCPPAVLTGPSDEPQRTQGWLETIAGGTLDDRLRKLPDEVLQTLGTVTGRLNAVLPWYDYDDEPASVQRWARRLVGVGDPLATWSRDELGVAFGAFCTERDSHVRALAAQLRLKEGPDAVREWLATLEEPVQSRVRAALQRII